MLYDYYKVKMVKMGHWFCLPLDSENWHAEITSANFYKTFGFYKGTLALHELDKGLQHCYFPQYYFDKLYHYITTVNKKDFYSLARILSRFYALKKKAKREIPQLSVKDYKQIGIKKLIDLYQKNRAWAHRITVYDQFGWTAEDYWEPYLENILTKKLGLPKGSSEYSRVLFALTKPAEISTTLEEKRDTLLEAYKILQKQKTLKTASCYLAKKYGWMPVFVFGTPWNEAYYETQLKAFIKKPKEILFQEYTTLKNYKLIQKKDIREVLKKYQIAPRDLQLFIDFGLALDTRNEAEYIVSLAAFYVLPFYSEIARRLYISVTQLRFLTEKEVVVALQGKLDTQACLSEKGKIFGWGFNHRMDKRIIFNPQEAEKLFAYLEKKSSNLHGNDEVAGKCASPGKVRGRIKIMNSPHENNKVKEGNILVCHATTVDYLPAMKRAAAFVTEVGSLTCHAAVVAREFGVPCIVSLKNATKNFKDNDLVEIDADQGIMKKVK